MLRDYLICMRIRDSNSFVRWSKCFIVMMRFLATFCFLEWTPKYFCPCNNLSHIWESVIYITTIVTIHLLNWCHIGHKIAINDKKIWTFHALESIERKTYRFIHDHKKIKNHNWYNRSIDKWHWDNRIYRAQWGSWGKGFFCIHIE